MTFYCVLSTVLKKLSRMNYDSRALNGVGAGLHRCCSFERDRIFEKELKFCTNNKTFDALN